MNPSEKGWLLKYLEFRVPSPIILEGADKDADAVLYREIQPTGLLYGHPIHSPFRHPKENRWNNFGKMKVVVLESFFYSSLLKKRDLPTNEDEWTGFYTDTVTSIEPFYEQLNPKVKKKFVIPFLKPEQDKFQLSEKALRKNLFLHSRWDNFWACLFHNSLLFLDTYYFGEWSAGNFHNIKWHKDAIKIMILKVLAAAAHSNNLIASQERNMFYSFLSTANLTKDQSRTLRDHFINGLNLVEIDLRQADTWLLKKYVLELAILMIWSDQKVDEKERMFLIDLCDKLSLNKNELDVSLIAIESFVIENWKEVYFLQTKHSYQLIGETIIARLKKLIVNHRDYFEKKMATLQALQLNNLSLEEMSDEQKEKVKQKLIDIIKQIPDVKVVSLPEKFLSLQVLLKIFPKELIPFNLPD